ncbi:unnamed protein product [Nippostrongylus brasiliensis]|uniref:Endo/exonuclease/phosphatase domain-containing protein n=1 Tax=Nippostrongylus brasiliensis TaxID=27835 RepID=A0A0N4YB45_NIPBR|nr:unnamed protein product [Nippostrongylus brasiliensis]
MDDRNAPARLSCGTKNAKTTSPSCLSLLKTVTAHYGSAGTTNSQWRRNLRAIGYQRRRTRASHLIVCTYNCRSINTAAQLSTLIEETKRISFHVIGLSEMKRKDPLSCTWSDGTAVFLGSRKAQSTSGVGFIVGPCFAKYVTSVTFHSHRLGVLTATMSKGTMVSIIQAYAPTADSSEELHEEFYEELQDRIRSQKNNCIIIGGDLNARIGPRRRGERFIGLNSAEIRNDTGEMLANFCETLHLYHGNSHFFKSPKRRWTHCSPNGQHLHELDHIMCNRKVRLTQIRLRIIAHSESPMPHDAYSRNEGTCTGRKPRRVHYAKQAV